MCSSWIVDFVIYRQRSSGGVKFQHLCQHSKENDINIDERSKQLAHTKLRWVVEAVLGAVAQQYQLLHHTLDNELLLKVVVRLLGFCITCMETRGL